MGCKSMKHKVEPVKHHSLLLIIDRTIIIQTILEKYYTCTHLNGSSGTNRFQMALRKMLFDLSHILAQSIKLSKLIFPVTYIVWGISIYQDVCLSDNLNTFGQMNLSPKNGQINWVGINP